MSNQGKIITCKAAVAWKIKEPLKIEQIEVMPPMAGEVRVKIFATGVCHSDWHTLDGKHGTYSKTLPCILGHEGAGIVESVGEGVTEFQVGDKVIPLYAPQCRQCENCLSPKTNLCTKVRATQMKGLMPDGTSRFRCQGQEIRHFMGCSTFSEYTVVSEHSLCKISKDADLEKVCLLGCAIPTGYGAVFKTAEVESGTTCAVWGMGAVGLAAIMGAKRAGATRIIAVDINSEKFEYARAFGATDCVNPLDYDKPIQEVLVDMTNGGLHYTIECCGSAQTMRAAFEATRESFGTCVAIGLVEEGQEVSFVPYHLCQGKVWKGSSFGGWKSKDSIPNMVEEAIRGELKLDPFITGFAPIEKINEAFADMLDKKSKSIRTVLRF